MTSYLFKSGLLAAAALAFYAAPAAAVEPTGPGVPAATGFKLNTLVKGLQNPWGMAFLPNGDILVTERPGRMRIIREGKLLEEPIKGVPPVFALGQGGLLDVSLHPKFAENNLVYFTYAQGDNKANHTMLGRGKLTGMELTEVKELLKVQPSKPGTQHFGSVIEWLPDGTLLFSVGDGGNAPLKVDGILARDQAQRMDRYAGKVLRVNDDGTPPKDNPFVNQPDAKPEIWSLGHRNIQGIARDPQNNRIYTTEHGPRGGDEMNLTEAGKNYGWPKASFGRDYGTNELITPEKSLPGMEDPKVVWIPVTAASGLAYYTGDKFPQWKGQLLSGGLVTQDVRPIKLDDKGNALGQESIKIGRRVRDVVQGPDGLVYVLTDHKDGELIRIEPEK